MNRNEIGVNAGKVWQLLSNNEKWSYGLLKRKSGLKDKRAGCRFGVVVKREQNRVRSVR
ncbi:winged helix-turn-helix domain-containing protein [Bacteroides ovatus]|nr:winged helix-turn-helix domain-containing protein [Bacteroides ovatus]